MDPDSKTNPKSDLRDTRARILDTADRLFGERGFSGTSMRALTAEAGVNLAAVNYHFGSKEALLRAAISRHMEPVNAERLRQLDKLEAQHPDAVPLERVLDALCRPTFEFTHASAQNAADIQRVVSLVHNEPADVIQPMLAEVFRPIGERFLRALSRTLPELDPESIEIRFHLGIGCLIHLISRRTPIVGRIPDARLVDELIHFLAAAFRAPRPERPA